MSCFYTSVTKIKAQIYERYVEDGVRKIRHGTFQPELYVLANTPEDSDGAISLSGLPLKKVKFADSYEMESMIEQMQGVPNYKMFGSGNSVVQYIAHNYPNLSIPFDVNQIHGCIIDIEVESGYRDADGTCIKGPFPEPRDAAYPVTAISAYSTFDQCFYSFGLETFNGEKLGTFDPNNLPERVKNIIGDKKIVYVGFDDEKELLKSFCSHFNIKAYDYISGWNSDTFDTAYLSHRIEKTIGRQYLNSLSPIGSVRKRNFMSKYGEEISYNIHGVSNLDMKEIVAKHAFVELDNNKLNTAAKHFLNEEKLDFGDSNNLTELYLNDYQNYIAYNILDSGLVAAINEKTKFIKLMYTLSFLYHCDVGDTNATVSPWQHLTYSFGRLTNEYAELRRGSEKEDYVGGYVKEPIPGRYKWVVSVDANALNV